MAFRDTQYMLYEWQSIIIYYTRCQLQSKRTIYGRGKRNCTTLGMRCWRIYPKKKKNTKLRNPTIIYIYPIHMRKCVFVNEIPEKKNNSIKKKNINKSMNILSISISISFTTIFQYFFFFSHFPSYRKQLNYVFVTFSFSSLEYCANV